MNHIVTGYQASGISNKNSDSFQFHTITCLNFIFRTEGLANFIKISRITNKPMANSTVDYISFITEVGSAATSDIILYIPSPQSSYTPRSIAGALSLHWVPSQVALTSLASFELKGVATEQGFSEQIGMGSGFYARPNNNSSTYIWGIPTIDLSPLKLEWRNESSGVKQHPQNHEETTYRGADPGDPARSRTWQSSGGLDPRPRHSPWHLLSLEKQIRRNGEQ